MSTLRAEVVRVEVAPHPNADRLDLCKVKGWQCVALKDQFKSGDLAVYIPIDSVLTPELVAKLGIEKMYHRRIRTVKLRNYVSQGLLMTLTQLADATSFVCDPYIVAEGDNVTTELGITKYEEPIPIHMSGIQLPNEPNFFAYTDIENYKNYTTAIKEGEMVVISEKIHGTNFRAAKINGQLFVGSHNVNLKENEGNLYWRAAKLLDLQNKLQEGEQLFGEVYGHGVQDLAYGLKQGEIALGVFDIMKDKQYLDHYEYEKLLILRGWDSFKAPIIYTGPWSDKLLDLGQGKSIVLPDQIKEGVVVKPLRERFSEELQGRCIIKVISDEYLLRKDGTERH